MEISYKIIPEKDGYIRLYNIEQKNIVLLIIINLHIDGKINDAKMFALFKQYNNNTLLLRKKTYHCKINNQWYNNESMFQIYIDCYHTLCTDKNINIEIILKYLNLLLNKNKNFCIDFLYFEFLKPMIESVGYKYCGYDKYYFDILSFLNFEYTDYMTWNEFKESSSSINGYCCSDCDGSLIEYQQYKYAEYLGFDFKEKILAKTKKFLNNFKTKYAQTHLTNKLLL
jgi:hypothetical protein